MQLLFVRLLAATTSYQPQNYKILTQNAVSPFLSRHMVSKLSKKQFTLRGVLMVNNQSLTVVKTESNRIQLLHLHDLLCQDWQIAKVALSSLLLINAVTHQHKYWQVGQIWRC